MFGVLGAGMLFGTSIKDENLKFVFIFPFPLLHRINKFKPSGSVHIKLRNERGIEGPRGERGDKGPKGFPGRCELNLDADCAIKNCRPKIQID